MIKLPEYFKNKQHYKLIELDDLSFVIYNQSIIQAKIETYLTKNLLVFILQGKKIIHTGSEDIIINSGEVFFAQKGSYLISEKLNQDNNFLSLIFFIDDKFIKDFLTKNQSILNKISTNNLETTQIYKISFSHLLNTSALSLIPYFTQEFSNKKELLKIKFEELFYHLINANKEFIIFLKNIQNESKFDLDNIMNENFTMSISLKEFARLTSRSLTTFKKDFKQIFDKPPKQWINQKRMERAHLILSTTDKTVTEVSFEVGFNNVSHFIYQFRKQYEVTPYKFKTKMNKI